MSKHRDAAMRGPAAVAPVRARGWRRAACAVLLGAGLAALGPVRAAPAAQAADAARADALAQEQAATAAQQLKAQEEQLHALRAANEQQQQALAKLQSRLTAAESIASWLPWLSLALVGSGVLSVWLALRARSLQSEREATGRAEAARAAAAAAAPDRSGRPAPESAWRSSGLGAPSTTAGLAPMVVPSRPAEAQASLRPHDGAGTAAAASRAAAPAPAPSGPRANGSAAEPKAGATFSLGTGVPPREVSVEELLDLEQQVDFFVVLGQDENAVDLLVSHIRATGGTSALPYLKLMEIYHRRGDAEDYERTRSRFNKRFSARAPAWGTDPAQGRTLDDYPDVIEMLQLLWPMPRKAQRELETLMHPNTRELVFDLPAFHDLLTLYGVVGDLLGHPEPVHQTDVDILLPLTDEPMDTTSPQPRLASRPMPLGISAPLMRMGDWPSATTASGRSASRESPRDAEHTTPAYAEPPPPMATRLDLDLSDFAPAPREFTEPAAFTDIHLMRDARASDFAPMPDDPPAPPRRPN